jgi:hypothetical protein
VRFRSLVSFDWCAVFLQRANRVCFRSYTCTSFINALVLRVTPKLIRNYRSILRVGVLSGDAGARGKDEGSVSILGQLGGPVFVLCLDDFRTGAQNSSGWKVEDGFYSFSGGIGVVDPRVEIVELKFVVHYAENLPRHDCTS